MVKIIIKYHEHKTRFYNNYSLQKRFFKQCITWIDAAHCFLNYGKLREFFDENIVEPQLVHKLYELTRNMSESDLSVLISTAERLNDK